MTDQPTYTICEDALPALTLPAGKTIVMEHTWGYDDNENMTDMLDVTLSLAVASTMEEVAALIISAYHSTVSYARFYYIEDVHTNANGDVVIVFGT